MTAHSYSNMSLVERKKLQWAREREELARLGVKFTNNAQFSSSFDKYSDKYQYASKPVLLEDSSSAARERRSSLPPLHKNQYNSSYQEPKHDRGGETSGYGSDSYNDYKGLPSADHQWRTAAGYESSSSCRDDRPKWQQKEPISEKSNNDPPNWVKRGLENERAIVVASSSPSLSPEQRCEESERPGTGSSYATHPFRSYIRGQNIPIDAAEMAERERRRQQALAHQEAIRQQLEERERKRQEERALKRKEEEEEERRIEREREKERKRKIDEENALKEKLERERKRKEALREALEIAQKEAEKEKERIRLEKMASSVNVAENFVEKSEEKGGRGVVDPVVVEEPLPPPPPPSLPPPKTEVALDAREENNNSSEFRSLTPRNNDQFTYFFQPSLDSLQNIQYAVLIPASASLPLAIPLNLPQSARSRVLTPTKFRNKCDSSTQTDDDLLSNTTEKFLREKICNLELMSYEQSSKREPSEQRRRRRSEGVSTEERPKWGANRPPTRYMKQSEKDPLYQRRKLKKKRDTSSKSYDEHNSSDDSQTGTPVRYKNKMDTRQERWRSEDRRIFNNVKLYQSEVVPVESDKDRQLYVKCCCRCSNKVEILKIEENSPRSENEFKRFASTTLNKLSMLNNGLIMEHEKWGNSSRNEEY